MSARGRLVPSSSVNWYIRTGDQSMLEIAWKVSSYEGYVDVTG